MRTFSSLLLYGAATLVCLVFLLHLLTPSQTSLDNHNERPNRRINDDIRFLTAKPPASPNVTSNPLVGANTNRSVTPFVECRDKALKIEQYRAQSVLRAVIVRFPSQQPEHHFVQFRWFYRSWIESEMFTLDRWRTDIIVLIDDDFDNTIHQSLEMLNCRADNRRNSRRQISRCIVVKHRLFAARSGPAEQAYQKKYPVLTATGDAMPSIDRVFAVYDYLTDANNNQTPYDVVMVTTMNTFLTTQFGKYIPVNCAFVIGTQPDYSTWFAQREQIIEFADALLSSVDYSRALSNNATIDTPAVVESLQKRFLFVQRQVDVPCDSTQTTYRTFIFHLKCYAQSTSLFSEKMFRLGAYDGFDKEPFNIYIAREYAVMMALQSKVWTLDALQILAVNVTRREVFT